MATRPRPQVSIRLADDSFIIPPGLLFPSPTIAGCYAPSLHLLAKSDEVEAGAMRITSIGDWFNRVRLLSEQATGVTEGNSDRNSIIMSGISGSNGVTTGGAIGLLNGKFGITYTINKLEGSSGATLEFGADNKFRPHWWSVNNILQYGATVVVGFKGQGFTGELGVPNDLVNPITDAAGFASTAYGYDIVFQAYHKDGWSGTDFIAVSDRTDVVTIVDALSSSEAPVIGVVNAGITGSPMDSDDDIDVVGENAYIISTAGFKNHFNSTQDSGSSNLISTPLCVDLAGIIIRNDRVNGPWISPAGTKKGQILNAVSLSKKLTTDEQDLLYDNNVNPIISVKGSGTFLFGDLTMASDTSSLIGINVIRTIIEIKRQLLPAAQNILFENNTPDTRLRFVNIAESLLTRIKSLGGLTSFSIQCDENNNPQQVVDSKTFVADIRVKIPGSINYILVTLTNT